MRTLLFALLLSVCTFSLPAQTPAGAERPQSKPSDKQPTKLPAVTTTALLKNDVDSDGTKAGTIIRATLQQDVVLPNEVRLPKGTVLLGSISDVVKHSKDKRNGVLVIDFNQAILKGKEQRPLLVRIKQIAPGSEPERIRLPNNNGNMVATTANSGGLQQMSALHGDETAEIGRMKGLSAIDGVFLTPVNDHSGAVYSMGADVYLAEGTLLTLMLAVPPAR